MAVEIASGIWELPKCRLVVLVWLWGGGASQKGLSEVMLGVCAVLAVFFPCWSCFSPRNSPWWGFGGVLRGSMFQLEEQNTGRKWGKN